MAIRTRSSKEKEKLSTHYSEPEWEELGVPIGDV
jgi:hypothetical protein